MVIRGRYAPGDSPVAMAESAPTRLALEGPNADGRYGGALVVGRAVWHTYLIMLSYFFVDPVAPFWRVSIRRSKSSVIFAGVPELRQIRRFRRSWEGKC